VTLNPNPFTGLDMPLAIVAHDAGAANLLAAWLSDSEIRDVAGYLAGPAQSIFAKVHPVAAGGQLKDIVARSGTLITGTGWASSLEHDARQLARAASVRSIAVIDHWTDYRERFSRSGGEVLPDAIWVSDSYASDLARKTFPDVDVVELPNAYLRRQADAIRGLEVQERDRTGHVLYVLEPIRNDWGPLSRPGEFLALDYFAANLDLLGLLPELTIRLRPHPSEAAGKYDAWIIAHPHLRLELDTSGGLDQAIAWSETVVGCQTYAMVVALAAGRRGVCSITPGMPPCVLPMTELIQLAQLATESR